MTVAWMATDPSEGEWGWRERMEERERENGRKMK
jgi:hypothetical protein